MVISDSWAEKSSSREFRYILDPSTRASAEFDGTAPSVRVIGCPVAASSCSVRAIVNRNGVGSHARWQRPHWRSPEPGLQLPLAGVVGAAYVAVSGVAVSGVACLIHGRTWPHRVALSSLFFVQSAPADSLAGSCSWFRPLLGRSCSSSVAVGELADGLQQGCWYQRCSMYSLPSYTSILPDVLVHRYVPITGTNARNTGRWGTWLGRHHRPAAQCFRPCPCGTGLPTVPGLHVTKLQSTPPREPSLPSPVLLKRMRSMAICSSLYSPI